ncbi:Phosphatidate cytidylyltransferase [Mycoplasmopsis californica]|uniref:Phosphatidate cytidylyltransferase n=1 Tax=Mycoplasmopsis equigenitalium TaxID=114883 RepID=A0ABY5J127_9BACT|nr:phosphatidate cytidylyltransferase [Mycoplasmopsis equigenitalium]UUD36962.1 phosphatidate cytidylyltransferase [Mycoplasmopsis equigenitalium]VEU69743.1 Phosphatidate cytidylyltransferase [Mycoplasmopsis californica]
MNEVKARIVYGVIFFMLTIFLFGFGIWFGSVGNIGGFVTRIVYLVILLGILGWAMYELCHAFKVNIWYSFLFTILAFFLVITPTKDFEFFPFQKDFSEKFLVHETGQVRANSLSFVYFVTDIFSNWYPYVIAFVIYLIGALTFYINTKKENKYFDAVKLFIYDGLLFVLSTFIIAASLRFVYYAIFLDYRYLILPIAVAMGSDIFGYFGGRLFGHKWIERTYSTYISPNKSWEGAIFQFAAGILITSLFVLLFPLFNTISNANKIADLVVLEYVAITLIMVLLPLAVIIGDLYFSLIKRLAQIKDFSNVIKGHGGLLDRFDSVSFGCFTVNLLLVLVIKY